MTSTSFTVKYNLPEMPSTFDEVVNLSYALSGELLKSSGVEVDGQEIINALSKILVNGDSAALKEKFNDMHIAINEQISVNNAQSLKAKSIQDANNLMTESSRLFQEAFIDNEKFFIDLYRVSLFGNGVSSENNELLELVKLFILDKETALLSIKENTKVNLSKDGPESDHDEINYLKKYFLESKFLDEDELKTPLSTLQSLSSKLAFIAIEKFVKILKKEDISKISDKELEVMILNSGAMPYYEMMEYVYTVNKKEIDFHKEKLNQLMSEES